jgi:hypothetical protein
MGLAVALSSHGVQGWLGVTRLGRLVDLAISIPFGALVYYGVCKMAKVAELEMATRALIAPALGWASRQRARI